MSASKFDLFTLPERYDALRAAVRAVVEARSPHTRPMWTNGRGDGGMATRCGQRIVMRRPQLRS